MGARFEYPLFQAFDSNGDPLSGGWLYSFAPGLDTPKALYTDNLLVTPAHNPVILNSRGEAAIYGIGGYKLVLTYTGTIEDGEYIPGVSIWTMDNVYGIGGSDSGVVYLSAYGCDLAAAVSAINTDDVALVIDCDCSVAADLTVPANIELRGLPGCIVTVASGKVLTISALAAGDFELFAGTGTVVFAPGIMRSVSAAWWADDVAKAAASIASIPAWSVNGNTGCIVSLGAKTYDISTSVIEYPGVILEGLGPAATCLKLAAAANCPVVTSYNFATLSGSGDTLASEDVPYLFGLRNLRINGNKTNQTGNHNGVSFFGKGFIIDNVIIHDCSGHGWYSECGRNTSIVTWQDDTLASVDGLVTRDNTLDGFHCEGGHDMYLGHLESHGNGGYGVYNTRTDYTDGTFTFGHIHTYGNTLGNYFGHEVFGNFLESEDQLVFHVDEDPDPAGGDSGTNYEPNISIVYVGTDASGVMLDIDRPNMNIGQLHAEVRGANVTKAVYVHQEQVTIGALNVEGNNYGAIGLHVAADNVNVCGGVVQHLSATNGLGIKLADTAVPVRRCAIDCNVMDCKTSFYYVDNAGFGNTVFGQYWVNTGQALLHGSCVTPANTADRHDNFNIIADIQGVPMTYVRTHCFTSEEFSLNGTGSIDVVITHNLVWPPDPSRDIMTSIQQTGGTHAWAIGHVKIISADATTVTLKVLVTTAAAGETARVVMWARNGGINV